MKIINYHLGGIKMKTPKEVLDLIKKEGVEVVDLRFMDFPGIWQHFAVPI